MWRSLFESIGDFFAHVLMAPMNWLASLELQTWWGANTINWIFMIICASALIYWLKQLRIFAKNNDDEQDTTAHSFLK